jgi:hypothetical protein
MGSNGQWLSITKASEKQAELSRLGRHHHSPSQQNDALQHFVNREKRYGNQSLSAYPRSTTASRQL